MLWAVGAVSSLSVPVLWAVGCGLWVLCPSSVPVLWAVSVGCVCGLCLWAVACYYAGQRRAEPLSGTDSALEQKSKLKSGAKNRPVFFVFGRIKKYRGPNKVPTLGVEKIKVRLYAKKELPKNGLLIFWHELFQPKVYIK